MGLGLLTDLVLALPTAIAYFGNQYWTYPEICQDDHTNYYAYSVIVVAPAVQMTAKAEDEPVISIDLISDEDSQVT